MKRFVLRLITVTSFLLLCTMLFNYKFDTFGVFDDDFSKMRKGEPDQHFVKIRYLLENPHKYQAYCFGSSRVGNIDLTKINNKLNYYNMTYSEGLPAEWLEDIKILLRHNVSIKEILLGIDDFSYKINPKEHESQLLRLPYSDEGNLKTYLAFLLRIPNIYPTKSGGTIFDIHNTGRPLHSSMDEKIEADVTAHISDKKFLVASVRRYGNRISETIDTINEIKDICKQHNINLIVFINPIHRTTYLDNNLDDFNEFKRQLANVTSYYDFSGLNKITANNYYYYETSHYRPMVGDMIIQRIFRPEEGGGFGVYVTKDNIEEHIRNLEAQIN